MNSAGQRICYAGLLGVLIRGWALELFESVPEPTGDDSRTHRRASTQCALTVGLLVSPAGPEQR
jgi:hypothetical protein